MPYYLGMTKELSEKIEEIATALEKAGLERIGAGADGGIRLTMLSKVRKTYLGTYLNQFTVNDKCRLWSDEWAKEYPQVTVSPVYRHNGTAEDVSVQVSFTGFHTAITKFPTRWEFARKDAVYSDLVKAGSSFYYIDDPNPLCVSTSGKEERLAKLKVTAGKRAVTGAVAKAAAACAAFEPKDHSRYEKSPRDYHADTSAEFNEFIRIERAAGRPV